MWVYHVCGAATMSRLTIDLTDQQHQSLKALAALQGKTIKQYAIERLLPVVDSDEAWEELKTLLRTRINNALAGKISPRTMDDILNEELAGAGPA
jgi:hypothetical protein